MLEVELPSLNLAYKLCTLCAKQRQKMGGKGQDAETLYPAVQHSHEKSGSSGSGWAKEF